MRHFLRVTLLLVALVATSLAQTTPGPRAPAPKIPADLDGRWTGEVRHGADTGFVGLSFERQPDGRVLTKFWMPSLNAYASAIGWLEFAGGKYSVAAIGAPFVLAGNSLQGTLFSPELTFTAHRGGEMPVEAPMPTSDTGPARAWTYHADAGLWATPAVVDGVAYLGDVAGHLHAVKVKDGTLVWKFAAHTPLFADVAATADAVYCAGDDGLLHKLARATGAELWHVDLGGGDLKRSPPGSASEEWDFGGSAPLVSGHAVYVGSADGIFHALDATSGRPLWSFKTAGKIRAAALVRGDRVYVGSRDHFLYALDRRTGALAWKFDTGSPITTPPVFAAGNIVIGTRDRALLYALDAATGQLRWSVYYWMSWVESAPVLVDGRLYIGGSDSHTVRALDPVDGHEFWSTQVWGWTWGTPCVAGDTIYYGTAGTPQYFSAVHPSFGALDRRTGALQWRQSLPYLPGEYVSGIAGSVVHADGKILLAIRDGTLAAYPVE